MNSRLLGTVVLAGMLLVGCGGGEKKPEHGAGSPSPAASGAAAGVGAGANADPIEVIVGYVRKEAINPEREWPAQTKAGESVDVRARVQGTLENFDFDEGTRVHRGQVLFQIDPAEALAALQAAQAQVSQARAQLSYAQTQVDVRKAQADLASARAKLVEAQQDVDRYKPLMLNEVIPRQTYDNAVAQRNVAKAQVDAQLAVLKNTQLSDAADIEVAQANLQAALAQVTQAELNLGYCTIVSPIDGIIGQLNVDPGNLVGQPGNTTPLVSISKVDPIYVNFSIAETDYLSVASSGNRREPATFELVLANGEKYPFKGRFGMVASTSDAKTGTIGIRAIFPNPRGILRDGQFGRIRAIAADKTEVVLVPQRAVATVQSLQNVYVVGQGDKIVVRNIETAGELGSDFIVASGLKGGERVVVDGIQKVKPGMVVIPKEESSSQDAGT